MNRSRFFSVIGPIRVLAFALLPILLASSPKSPEIPAIRLVQAGKIKLDDLVVEDAAVIDENTVVIVGRKGDVEDTNPVDLGGANGAIVDLAKKSSQPFTNGHRARIHSVSVARGRVATASTKHDPILRIWDMKVSKTIKQIEIDKLFEGTTTKYRDEKPNEYAVAWFHKKNQIALAAAEHVILLDPARPDDVTTVTTPLLTRRDKRENVISSDWETYGPVVVSPKSVSCVRW